ncbi:hypothetical protein CRUP_009284 [Coryphaenoides rupestris]|nr:hypothetical protein CRUP_009284 [Coryphaenoides rupestris]
MARSSAFSVERPLASATTTPFRQTTPTATLVPGSVVVCQMLDMKKEQIDSDDVITREEQIYLLIGARAACDRSIQNQMALIKGQCVPEWDGIVCWPRGGAGQWVSMPCPEYIYDFNHRGLMSNCLKVFRRLHLMYTVGYSISLLCLLVAVFTLCYFKRLHCTRNHIHIHLFLSFICRAVSIFVKDAVLYSVSEDDQGGWQLTGHKPELGYQLSLSPSGKLLKSTLVLMPLFGVHYMLFMALPYTDVSGLLWQVQMHYEMFFNSFQVQAEVKKAWLRRSLVSDLRQKSRMTSSGGGVSGYYGNMTTNSVSFSAATSRGGVMPAVPPSMHPIRSSPQYAFSDLMETSDPLQTPSSPGRGSGAGLLGWSDGDRGGETPGGPQKEGHLDQETML